MKSTDERAPISLARKRRMIYGGGLAALVAVMVWFSIGLLFLQTHAEDSSTQTRVQDSYTGQWIIEPAREASLLHLTLTYSSEKRGRGQSINSFSLSPEQLRGLTSAQLMSAGTNVQFQLVRDAGTFNCEGWFKGGRGSGHFVFAANPAFVAELKKRNYEAPSDAQLFKLAMSDTGLALLDELQAQSYERPTLDQLVRMGDHGVSLEYVRALKAQGYTVQSVDLLTRMVDHGVSVSFIKELEALGYKRLPVETLIRTVDHGVTPDYIQELAALGHHDLPLEQLTRLVDHGVNVNFIKEIEAAGYGHPSLDQLVRMQDHGVNARFIEKMKARGFDKLTIDELVKMADHGFND
jgi:archaellum component FlaD/FlaE